MSSKLQEPTFKDKYSLLTEHTPSNYWFYDPIM